MSLIGFCSLQAYSEGFAACQQPQPLNTLLSGLRNHEILNSLNRPSGLSSGNHTSKLLLIIGKLEGKIWRDWHIPTQPEKGMFWRNTIKITMTTPLILSTQKPTTGLKPVASMLKLNPFLWDKIDYFYPGKKHYILIEGSLDFPKARALPGMWGSQGFKLLLAALTLPALLMA